MIEMLVRFKFTCQLKSANMERILTPIHCFGRLNGSVKDQYKKKIFIYLPAPDIYYSLLRVP